MRNITQLPAITKRNLLSMLNSKIIVLFIGILSVQGIFAQTNTFTGSASWNTGGNWSLGHIPTTSEDAVIAAGATVTSLSSGAVNVCKTLTVNGTLTFSGGSPRIITVSGSVTVASTGTINMTGSNQYYIDYNGASFSVASGATLTMTSTNAEAGIRYTGTGASTISNSSSSAFGSLIVSGTGVLTTGSAVTFGKAITINSGCTFAASHTVTANAAVSVAGTFQLNSGGWATGTGTWSYTSTTGTLRFANTGGNYTVNADVFWPASNGPYNVNITGSGINMTVARTVPTTGTTGVFQTAGQVTGTALTLNGTAQLNAGGFFSTTPTYGASSTLIYATASTSGTPYGVGNEWTGSSATAGSGIPNNVTINNNTFITMPNGNRGMAGAFNCTSGSGITLNATAGDLGVGGNFTQAGTFTHNTRAVTFYGSATQTINGANLNSTGATNCFAYLINNNSAAGGLVIGVNATVDAAAGDVLQILNTGPLNIGAFTLTVNGNGGNILVSGGTRVINFTSASGVLRIVGSAGTAKTVTSASGGVLSVTSTTANGQLQVQGAGFNPGSALTTIQTGAFLTINSGGFVATNKATYATGSTLSFRTGGTYNVGAGDNTWGSGASGAGVPDKVELNLASTVVNINEDRTARSTVTVTVGTLNNNTNTLNVATGITTGATAFSIAGGTVANGGGTINIGASGGGNQALSITASGVLTISSGTVNLNGNGVFSSGTFNMSNGNFNIDPNSGTLATSVASGTVVLAITSVTVNASGGTITFVDPPNAGTARTLNYSQTGSVSMTGNTIVVGGSSGTNTTTATVGFAFDTWASTGRLQLGNVTVNGGNTTDRYMSGPATTADEVNIGGTVTINSGSELRIGTSDEFHLAGNIVNNGTLTSLNTATGASASAVNFDRQSTPTSNTVAQTVSGSGTFRNSTGASTAKFSSITFDNTASGSAVTFSIGDVTVSNATSFVNGIIDIGNNNSFTYVGTGVTVNRTNGYVLIQGTGLMNKDFATGASSFTFHVGENTGTTEYSPFSLNFTANNTARTIGVRPVDATDPNIDDVDVQTDFISRYWQLTNSAGGTYTYTGTATYVAADINGTEGNMKMNVWNGASPWKQAPSTAASNVLTITSGVTETTFPITTTSNFTGRVKAPQTYTWDGSTDNVWTTATNWTPDRNAPASNDVLLFDGGTVATPTVTSVPTETIGKLLFTNNVNATLQSAAAVTLTISGGAGTDLDIPSGSTLQLGSTGANSINLSYSGTQTASIAGTLSLLTNTSNNNTYTATNSTTTVTGTVNSIGVITSTASNLLFTTGTYNHNYTSTYGTIPTASWTANTSTCAILGYTSPAAGSVPSGITQTFGNFTWNTPSMTTIPNLGGSTITSVGTFTMTSTGTAEFRLGSASSGTIVCSAYSQTGGTINCAAGAGLGTIRVSGTFNQSGGTIDESSTGSGLIEFNGSSSQSVTTGGTISNTINYRVSNAAGIAVTGTLTLNANTTFTAGQSGTAVTSGTVVYNATGTTLSYTTLNGTQTTGNEFPATNGPVNLTVNNTFATPELTLSGARTVSGTLTVTNGRIILGANDLTLTGTLSITTPGAARMIVTDGAGLFKRSIPAGTGPYLFPVGDNTGTIQYTPVTIQFLTNSTTRIVGAKVNDAASGNINTPSAPSHYLTRYWTFSENGAGGTYTYYINPAVAITGAEDEVGTAALITPAYWDGSAWTVSAGSYTSGSLVSNATGVSETVAPLGTVEWTGRSAPAVSYTWVGFTDGAWTTAANWNPSGIPGSTDQVTLTNGSTGAAANLNLTSAVSVNDITFNGTGSFFTVGATGSIAASGNVTYTAGTGSWNAASTFTISSASSQTIPAFSYGNLTASGGNRVWSAGTTGIGGTFIAGAGTYTATTGSVVDFTSAGSITIAAVNYYDLSNSGNGARTLSSGTTDIANTYTPTTGTTTATVGTVNFSSAGSQTIPASSYFNITNTGNGPRTLASTGTIAIAGPTFTPGSGAYTVTGSTVLFSNATGFTLPLPTPAATNNYNNLSITGAGTYPLGSSVTIGGNYLQSAGIVTVSNGAVNNSFAIGGDFTIIGSRFNLVNNASATGATVTVGGNVSVSTSSTTTGIFMEPTASATGAAVFEVNGNAAFSSSGTRWVDFGATGTLTGNQFRIKGNLSTTGSGTFYTASSNAAGADGFVFNGTGTIASPQTYNYGSSVASDYISYVVNSGTVVRMLSNLVVGTSNNPYSNFTVNGGLDVQGFVISGGNATVNAANTGFVLASGGTLITAHASGLSSSITAALRTFTAGANYVFNASGAQSAGFTGLTIGNPTSITVSGTSVLTPDVNVTFGNTATLNVNATATLVAAATRTFTFGTGGVVNIDGTVQTANTSGTGALYGNATSTILNTNSPTINTNTTTSTIVFNGAAAQAINSRTYGNITVSNGSVINQGGTVTVNQTLFLNTGDININGNSLVLNGPVTRTTGNIRGTITSNLTVNGTAGSLFFGTLGTQNYLKTLTIGASGSATLGNALNITAYDGVSSEGVLTVTPGGTLASAGNLAIKSNVNGTARIAQGSTSGGYITGDVSVERFIRQNTAKAWRLLASTTSGQTINQSWQENQAPLANGNAGFGTMITSNGANLAAVQAQGFDTLSALPSMYSYNSTTDDLDAVTTTTGTQLDAHQGYFLFVRGDRSPGQFNTGSVSPATTSTVLRSRGTLFLGDQTAVATGTGGFGLVRNPYPSRIDMRNIVRSGITNAYQVWDARLGGGWGVGGYQTFTWDGVTDYRVTPGGGSYGANNSVHNFIESGAAFFIQGPGGSTAQVTEACKTTGSSNDSYRPSAINQTLVFNLYAINPTSTDMVDGGLVYFNDIYSNDVDIEDVRKSPNFRQNFGLIRNGVSLAVEKRQPVAQNDTVFFNMSNITQLQYRIDISTVNIDPLITTAILEDRYTGTNTTLDLAALNEYTFTADANAASRAANRFRIVFRTAIVVPVNFVSIKAAQSGNTKIAVEWKVANQLNVVRYEIEKSTDGNSFAKVGTVTANNGNTYNWVDENAVRGYNYFRVKSVDNNGQFKYTEIVKVNIGGKPGITVSPNPLQGNYVNILLTEQQAGKYGIRLLNIAGQVMYSKEVFHNGGSASQSFALSSLPSAGIYQLEISGPANTKHVERLIINPGN